ncbi:PAQR family membrane homeostasis protein TrhA [Lysinibacillus xylanilyticus]|uniref:Hemolysin III family protein n=1 Tax=Lysinibacillus xylanilyticus TaxID=582475 RepID=A0ABT4EUR6_9BACI|nr:hemolysin III family protein [Lysinibacillus xylanilyticus]MCY9549422.1 hemolysin III family protein [Lysinibacillus xylanilyticus]MED3804125.1 hemolysin III family protein [Lysinibacillus xylanilyticus]
MMDSFDYKTWKEELWNAITHGIGFIASIPALIVLILAAVQTGSALQITAFTIFGASVIVLFLMSTLLHSMPEKYKHFFAILDHSSIYILIAGTYTPFLLIAIGGTLGITLLCIIWSLAILGVIFKCFFINRFEKLSLIFYIGMGWLIIFAIKPLYLFLGFHGFALLLAGGLFYTIGAIFYAWRSLPYNHTIWHLFVLAGCGSMYACVYFYL